MPGFLLRPIDGAFRVWYIVFMIIYVPSHDKGGEMPRSDDTYTVSVNLPKELEPRLRALAEHRIESLSSTCAAAIRDAIVHYEEGDTTRTRIAKIERKLNMVLLLVWAMPIHSGKVEITADDVRRFRELVTEIQI